MAARPCRSAQGETLMLKERWSNTPEDGKIKNIQQTLCHEVEGLYPAWGSKGTAKRGLGWCQGDICFAGWLEKLHQVWWLETEFETLSPETKHMLLVESITSPKWVETLRKPHTH